MLTNNVENIGWGGGGSGVNHVNMSSQTSSQQSQIRRYFSSACVLCTVMHHKQRKTHTTLPLVAAQCKRNALMPDIRSRLICCRENALTLTAGVACFS